jgi:hypothetical protein
VEFGKKQIALTELTNRIDVESNSLEERRQRLADELGMTAEEMVDIDFVMEELKWLGDRTGYKTTGISHLFVETERQIIEAVDTLADDEVMVVVNRALARFETVIFRASRKLQAVLAFQQKQRIKCTMFSPVRRVTPRNHTRTHRRAARPTFARSAGNGGDSGDSDSGDGDSPGHFHQLAATPASFYLIDVPNLQRGGAAA